MKTSLSRTCKESEVFVPILDMISEDEWKLLKDERTSTCTLKV